MLLALMSAIGGRLLWLGLGDRRGKVAAIVGATTMLVIHVMPWTYARFYDDLAVNDISDVQQFEREAGNLLSRPTVSICLSAPTRVNLRRLD